MSATTHRSVRTLLLAAAAFALGTAHMPAMADETVDASSAIEHASTLLADGKNVRAKAMLLELSGSRSGLTLTDDQERRIYQMLATADRRLREGDPLDISLQQAELNLLTDDLVSAEQNAMAVLGSADATPELRQRATAVFQLTVGRKAALAPTLGQTVDQAVAMFREGKYAEAKGALDRVARTGVSLDPQRARLVESYRSRIVDLEQANGQAFVAPVTMGLFAEEEAPSSSWLLDQPSDDRSSGYVVQELGDGGSAPAASASWQEASSPPADTSDVDVIEAARRFEAQSLLGEAKAAFDERRLSEAMDKYSRVINEYGSYVSADDLTAARQRVDDIRVQLSAQGGPSDALNQTVTQRALERDRVMATYNNLMDQANSALAEKNTTKARDLVAQARVELNRGRDVLAEADYERLSNEIETQISKINSSEEQIRVEEAKSQADRIARETAEKDAEQLRQRDQKINEALERVRQLQLELKYDEALQVINNTILFLDPNNPSGLLLKDVIEDTIIYRKYWDIQRQKDLGFAGQSLDNQGAMIPPHALIDYPEDWPAISLRRGSPLDLTESAGDRAVRSALKESSGPIQYDDNFLVDVIANIATRAGVDIDVDWNSLRDVGVDQETPVSLRLSNSQWDTVLDRVLAKVSEADLPAGWSVQDGIVTIASKDVLSQHTTLVIYDINDLLFEVPYFDNAPEFDLSSALQSGTGGGGGGQSPFQGSGGQSVDTADRDERIQQIIDLVQASIDPNGWVDLGGTTGTIQELNGNLIITQTPSVHREVLGLLDQLRQIRSLQINVEARFLLVSENFFEQIGFDLDVYLNTNNEFDIARTLDPTIDLSNYFNPETGELLRQIPATGNFDVNGSGTIDAGDFIPVFSPGTQGDNWSVIRGAQNSFGITNSLIGAASSFAGDILNTSPALGITGRFLDDIQVDFLIEATQADQRSTSLTAPRLTFMNGQRAWIAVATQTTFISDLTPVVSDAAVGFDPTISQISKGVVMDVEGVVSSDKRYVTMTVRTALSDYTFDPDSERSVQAQAGGTGGSTGSGTAVEGTVQIPVTTTTQINTTTSIPDQGTVLLGGQRVITEVEVETGVPVLSKIPVLKRFFSNRSNVKEDRP
ncbi:MAG: hypothetical protein R3B49_08315 [Phycisphaerales bacterium]